MKPPATALLDVNEEHLTLQVQLASATIQGVNQMLRRE